MLGLAIAWALFVPVADWLAHHDVGSVKGPLHETAVDNARGRLLTLGAGLFAAGALVFTAQNYTLSREGQVTDRYTKAITQLGSKKKLDVRIGGIYALERVARDSRKDHPTVMEVLAAFIREHSHEQWPAPEPSTETLLTQMPEPDAQPARTIRPDVQAAVTVIARRISRNDSGRIDLSGAFLTGADLSGADLTRAILTGADLTFAFLSGAFLTGAILTGADLTDATLSDADLRGAFPRGAILVRANLTGADLRGAHLTGAHLTDAILVRADLRYADLRSADLTRANLRGADLTGATLTDATPADTDATLTDAILSGARWPTGTPVPEGWKLNTGSDRLERAGTGSRPTEAD